MELEVQKHLRKYSDIHNGLASLESLYGIVHKFSEEFPELVLLKYSQVESPMGEKIVQECRGLILNTEEDWAIVSRPYNKFFNYGEGNADSIDWSSAKVYEKLDGSLMTLYWYRGWRVASSGNPDAAGPVWNFGGNTITFKELFWNTWNELGYSLPRSAGETKYCFMFELMTPLNKVVVQHHENKLVLHGIRDIRTGKESDIDWAGIYNYELCDRFGLVSIDEVVSFANRLNPIISEGYIVVDKDFNRIKVKSPQYVALHHIKDSMSPRKMLEIVRTNESSEFLNYFPELESVYEDVLNKYNSLVSHIVYQLCELEVLKNQTGSLSRKDVGLATKGKFWQGIVFPIIFDNKSLRDCLSTMPIKKLEQWINAV